MTSKTADHDAADFEPHRRHLLGLAYRMLGVHADAEDAVQETWLRWHAADTTRVEHPRAFLSQTVTRLCLDRIKSAHAQREVYVGPWLPEPLVSEAGYTDAGPEMASELASDLSFAFMLALERLSPLERAAFLLHDVFDMEFSEVADAVGRSEAACRQLATRAREHVRESRPRFKASSEQHARLAASFLFTAQSGDLNALTRMLTDDALLLSDGGGRIPAAQIPVRGAARVAKTMSGFARKHAPAPSTKMRAVRVNGLPGFLVTDVSGAPIQTIAFEFTEDGLIRALYIVRNPDKLTHLAS